jgi:hypothetical protein
MPKTKQQPKQLLRWASARLLARVADAMARAALQDKDCARFLPVLTDAEEAKPSALVIDLEDWLRQRLAPTGRAGPQLLQ